MKKLILLMVFVSICGIATTYAQDSTALKEKGRKGQMRDRRTDMYADLNLTADQKEKLKTLNDESMAQRKAIMDDNSLSQEQKREKFMAFRKEQKEKRDAILTPEQSAKLDAKMKERNGRRGGGFGGNRNQ